MLQQVLQEVESAPGAVNLNDLARKLGIERSALDGIIQFWVRKGRLRDDELEAETSPDTCSSGTCKNSCPGPKDCSFVMTMPRTYSLILSDPK